SAVVELSRHDNPPPPDATQYLQRKSSGRYLNYTASTCERGVLRARHPPRAAPLRRWRRRQGLLQSFSSSRSWPRPAGTLAAKQPSCSDQALRPRLHDSLIGFSCEPDVSIISWTRAMKTPCRAVCPSRGQRTSVPRSLSAPT